MKFSRAIVVLSAFFMVIWPISFADELPEIYQPNEESDLQEGDIDSAWAYASLHALELNLKSEYDLSESNLIGETSQTYLDGFKRTVDETGNLVMATSYFAGWRGPILEVDHPYPQSGLLKDYQFGTGHLLKHVQDIVFIDESTPTEQVKSYIYENGAVAAHLWWSEASYNPDTSAYYHSFGQPQPGFNSLVTLVGWDDSYDKSNFSTLPKKEGAYRVRSSAWPQDRYVSYEDKMLFNKEDDLVGGLVFNRVDERDNYDHIYQYDQLGYNASIKSSKKDIWFATVFSGHTLPKELLSAVAFYTLEDDVQYEIWIKDGYKMTKDFDVMTKLKSGTIEKSGYHTIDLDEVISLKEKNLAVAIRLTGYSPKIAIETSDGLKSDFAVLEGKSYILEDYWKQTLVGDICLKAFTTDKAESLSGFKSVADMTADVDYLVNWLKDYHVDLKSKEFSLEQIQTIQSVRTSIEKPLSSNDYHFALKPLVTMMQDGSTLLKHNFAYDSYIDLPFKWLEEGLVVTNDTSMFQKGDVVVSIGGVGLVDLDVLLREQFSADNKFAMRKQAESQLQKWTLLTHFDLTNDDDTVTVLVNRKGDYSYRRLPKIKYTTEVEYLNEPWFDWHIEKDNKLAYFRLNKFPYDTELEALIYDMDLFFKAVKNQAVDNVIIDIRNNSGGSSKAMGVLLSYLHEAEVLFNQKKYSYDLYKYDGQPKFEGQVYLLIGPDSRFVSAYVSSVLSDANLVTTVGESTGSKPAFNSYGGKSIATLPGSGWQVSVASFKYLRPKDKNQKETTLVPDIEVITTASDLKAGRDSVMETIRRMLNTNRIYDKSLVKVDISSVDLDTNDFESNAFSNVATAAYIVDATTFKTWPLVVESDKMLLPENLDKRKDYYLLLENSKGYQVGSLFNFVDINEADFKGLKPVVYNSKYVYAIVATESEIIRSISSYYLKLLDAEGQSMGFKRFQRGTTSKTSYILIPKEPLLAGLYTIVLEAGAVHYTDGSQSPRNIILEFEVE